MMEPVKSVIKWFSFEFKVKAITQLHVCEFICSILTKIKTRHSFDYKINLDQKPSKPKT